MDFSAPEYGQAGIYLIRNIKSGVVYIGSTRNFRQRWRQHRSKLLAGKHANRHLQNAWNRHGPDAFEWVMAEILPLDDALLKEREIHYLDMVYPDKRQKYNIALGPVGGHRPVFSDEMRANMSRATRRHGLSPAFRAFLEGQKGKPGKPANEVQRANLAKGLAKLQTPEVRERARLGQARRKLRELTEKERARAEARKGKPWTEAQRLGHERARERGRTPAQLAADERRRGTKQSPELVQARVDGVRRRYENDPDARERFSQAMREVHARKTPEQKADFAAKMSAWHKERREREARNRPATQPALFDAEE